MADSEYRDDWLKAYGRSLSERHSPRLEMFVILAGTAFTGFVASRVMLRRGLVNMALRYPASAIAAYLAFFIIVALWVRIYASRDLPQNADFSSSRSGHRAGFDGLDPLDLFELPLDEGGCLLFVLLAVAFVVVLVAAYLIAQAPVLLAELLLESSIVGALYPALRATPRVGWLRSLLRRTAGPVLIVVVVFGLLGLGLQSYAPEAKSIGGVLRHSSDDH